MATRQSGPFGSLLRSYRTSAGLSQEQLAEAANVSVRSIGDLERGVQRTPYRDTVRAMAEALGLQGAEHAAFEASARGSGRQASTPAASRPLPTGNFLGAQPEGSLVGRETELEQIASIVKRVRAGAGQLVLLPGEPGIGKTRLAQETVRMLQEHQFLVATGSCYEFQQTVPYGPFLDVLATVAAAAPPVIRNSIEQRWPYLSRLLPDMFPVQATGPPVGPEEQQWLFRAVTAFLLALADLVPVGILVDDLQWADLTSLALLHHLASSTRGNPVFLLGTYRTVEVDRQHRLAQVLPDLERAGVVQKVVLQRLSADRTAALLEDIVGGDVPREARQLIHVRTEGNPFLVRNLVRALLERDVAGEKADRWTERGILELAVPASVRGVIGQRVARLSPFTQIVLQQASVLGQTFAFDDLLRLGSHDGQSLGEALLEAAAGGLVQEIDDYRYAFDHALTQQALYEEIACHRRRMLHRAAAEAFDHRPIRTAHHGAISRASDIAWHFQKGAEPKRALPFAVLAAGQAQRMFAHEEAEHQYRVAVHLAQEVGDQESEAQSLESLGNVLTTRARYADALQVFEQSAGLLRRLGDGEGECRVWAEIAAVQTQNGTPDEALSILQSTLQRFDADGPSPGLVSVYVTLADLYGARGERDRGLEAAERAVELARALGDDVLRARATIEYGFALVHFGSSERGLQTLEEACCLAQMSGDLPTMYRARSIAAGAYRDRAEFRRTAQYAGGALAIAERIGDPTQIADMVAERGRIAMYRGKWKRARSDLERAVKMSREIGDHRRLWHTIILLGEFYCGAGELDESSRCLEEGMALGTQARYGLAILWAQYHLALLELRQARPGAARARLVPLLEHISPADSATSAVLGALARTHCELGDTVRALQIARQAVEVARVGQYCLSLVEALLGQGVILAGQGEQEEVESVLAECLCMARSMPYPYVEAQALYARGLTAIHREDSDRAREQFGEALVIFERLGARWDIQRTLDVLSTLEGI